MNGDAIWPGRPFPLGATPDESGTNFAICAPHAEAIDLCLYDGADRDRELRRVRLQERTGHVWHVYLPGVGPGARCGRVVVVSRHVAPHRAAAGW